MGRTNVPNLVGGLLVILLALPFAIESWSLFAADRDPIGPGAFPLGVAVIAITLGLVICLLSLRGRMAQAFQPLPWRAPAAILGAIAAFTLLITLVGMVPTLFVTTWVASLGSGGGRRWQIVGVATFMGVFGWLLFTVALGMSIPAFRSPI